MGKLTAVSVRTAKHPSNSQRPIRIGDGDGLYLQVAAGHTKSWLLRYTLRGKAREMGLGPVGEPPAGVPLAKARALAGEARALLRDGRDPLEERQAARLARQRTDAEARERTFRAAAKALVDSKRSGWRNAKHAAQWLATLEAHAFPVIGDLPVAAIGTDEVLRVLRPIWERIPETASRVRQRIEAVLDAARVKGWRSAKTRPDGRAILQASCRQPRKVKRVQPPTRTRLAGDGCIHGSADRARWHGPASVALCHLDRSSHRRGARHALARGGSRREGLDRARRPHEGGETAPRSIVIGRSDSARPSAPAHAHAGRSGVSEREEECRALGYGVVRSGAPDERGYR